MLCYITGHRVPFRPAKCPSVLLESLDLILVNLFEVLQIRVFILQLFHFFFELSDQLVVAIIVISFFERHLTVVIKWVGSRRLPIELKIILIRGLYYFMCRTFNRSGAVVKTRLEMLLWYLELGCLSFLHTFMPYSLDLRWRKHLSLCVHNDNFLICWRQVGNIAHRSWLFGVVAANRIPFFLW